MSASHPVALPSASSSPQDAPGSVAASAVFPLCPSPGKTKITGCRRNIKPSIFSPLTALQLNREFTHSGTTSLLHCNLIVGVAIVTGVKERLVNVALAGTAGFFLLVLVRFLSGSFLLNLFIYAQTPTRSQHSYSISQSVLFCLIHQQLANI